ncbi:hypothetical protein BGZ95_003226 [Linnemannia exigua]|uniref:Rho-GAP domain-containing protein n=1 Tax=Linnemannia exigua TaxID=604196 RepID=A0AAD4H2V9_9FUNG|nr:hypothetical protein BGZ95_003226 [Linnemannia exigua]
MTDKALPLPPHGASPFSASAPSSPNLSTPSSSSKFQPLAINISHSPNSLEPPQASPRRGSIAAHLMNFASKSTTSLNILSSSAPPANSPLGPGHHDEETRSQVMPLRSSPFSNPFKKLQSSFHSSGSSKKSLDSGSVKTEKLVSSASSVHSMMSWRSKGAEILSKKAWGRTRKNSEPTLGAKGLPTTPLFGSSLEEAVRMSHIPGTPMVPAILVRCTEFLETKGIDEVGLYRVPGSHASVQKLKLMFDSGKDHNLLAMDAIDPNDIATLLKLYLRELPTPLLPAVFLEQFQTLLSTDRQICHNLRGILIGLPRPNYVVLSYLCHHLSRIAAHADKTKMNVSNLGVVFAPTLSIGSVLFKALLGGYYDTVDSAESREKGLKIVWGGLLQEVEYDVSEWPEDSTHLMQPPLTPAQEIAQAASTLTVPSTTPFPTYSQSAPADHTFTAPPTSIDMALSAAAPSATTIGDDEEAKLMAAMVLREEMASRGHQDDETSSNASSSSCSIPCTDTTALSAASSPGMSAKDQQAFEASFTSPSMAFSPTPSSTPLLPSHLTSAATLLPAGSGQDIFSSASTIPIVLQESPNKTVFSPLSPPPSLDSISKSSSNSSSVAPTVHITIDAGSPLSAEFGSLLMDSSSTAATTATGETVKEVVIEKSVEVVGAPATPPVDVPQKTATADSGAPQLPPLEGLMIAL